MKTRRLFLTLSAFLFCAVAIRADEAADKAEILKLENEFAALIRRNDATAIEAALAPEWKMIGPEGAIYERAELVDLFKSGKLKIENYQISGCEVQIHADAAIVTGVDQSKGKYDGESFDLRERFSDFYVRKNGKWVCVWSHSSMLGEE
jgi:ketosteroid isomerase-like protein